MRMTVTVTEEMYKALQRQAKIRRRSVGGLIRLVMTDYLEGRGIELRDGVKRGGYRVSPEGLQEYAEKTRLMVLTVKDAEQKMEEARFAGLIPIVGRGKHQVQHRPGEWHGHSEVIVSPGISYLKVTLNHPMGFVELGDVVAVKSPLWDRVVGRAQVIQIGVIGEQFIKQPRLLALLGYADGEAFVREHGQLNYWVIELAWVELVERIPGVWRGR